jgi:hypothetical protein
MMEAESGARDVAVDQASVRVIVGEAGLGTGAYGNVQESRRLRGPGRSGAGIHGLVAVAGAVRDPMAVGLLKRPGS